MKNLFKYICGLGLLLPILSACEDDYGKHRSSEELVPISLSGEVQQLSLTRVNDNGFCNGDVMGVYIVDYAGSKPGTLQNHGNRGDNVRHTFDEAAYKWNSAYDIYWKDKNTAIDVYAYYPFANPADVAAYEFEVKKDQAKAAVADELGGYEASDFLWGKVAEVAPTELKIRVPLRHRMSSAKVMLVEGTGFKAGEWANLEKSVLVKNVKRKAVINLSDGVVKEAGEVSPTGTIPYQKDNAFRAIVVPQTINASTVLFSITVDGVVYSFKKNEPFTYVSGKMHNFSIKVDKKEATGEFTFSLAGESITAWENDDVSHDATLKEYVVIESQAGKLKEAIQAANKDYRKLKNLKIKGEINGVDFYFMRDSMDVLESLNLKEVKIAKTDTLLHFGAGACQRRTYGEDEIPEGALSNKTTLVRLVLPDKLKIIHVGAFTDCKYLTGSLVIPEGVTEIKAGAFNQCKSLTGTLSLPSTLKYIGTGYERYWYGGAFSYCGFSCELIIPNGVEYIGNQSFEWCKNLYGNLHLPDKLKDLGSYAFMGCSNLSGNLSIPQGVSVLKENVFCECGFDGTLLLHDGITSIGDYAFNQTHLKGELILPKNLTVLSDYVFNGCDFSGSLKLPSSIRRIGDHTFAYNWRLMGVVEFPEGIQSIGSHAFESCRSIEGLVIPESMESIMNNAFLNCFGIGSIVCKGAVPAYVQPGAFDGVAKDNFTVEVPQSAIQQYQIAVGWSDFKRIAAHHELVCRPAVANAINTECTRRLILNAEGDWEVASIPEWCSLSQTTGSQKADLTLTIHELPKGSAARTGEIVFRLKAKDYTHKCVVKQYNYEYAENQIIELQKATKGNRGGINLVFLGDGFDALDISEGKYMKAMKEQVEHFFGVEPYKTYRDYFNVYTAIAVSPESGIGSVNTIRYAKFETTFTGGVGLRCDYDAVFRYAMNIPSVTKENLKESLIIMTPNTTDYGGICQMWDDGSAIAFCPMSTYGYPLDTRGVIQHEAGGHGFGKLGDEYIYHNEFIDFCGCSCCGHVFEFNMAKANGWYDNLSLSGKTHEVPWSHFIFDKRYSDIVDIFEGGFMHNRGVFRSELNSCMNNNVPYFSTVSRESIVKRIKRYAGEEYSFEEFVRLDKRDAGVAARNMDPTGTSRSVRGYHMPPKIHKGSPL